MLTYDLRQRKYGLGIKIYIKVGHLLNVNKHLSKGSLGYMTCIVIYGYIWYNLYMDLLYFASLIKRGTYDIW